MSIFKADPGKKILKERDALYKKSVILQRNGDLREYGIVMKRIEDLENEYDKLKNNKQKVTDTSFYCRTFNNIIAFMVS
jgi:hypothetical protein